MVGGELTLQSLDLAYSATTGFYNAPIQADGERWPPGHRRLRPAGVLAARHAEPVDRPARVPRGLSTLQSGQKFELPFDVLVVFATNVRPARTGRRSVPAPHPVQGALPRARPSRSSRPSSRAAARALGATAESGLVERLLDRLLPPAEDRAARLPSPRSDHAGVVARLLSESTAASDLELLEAACAGYFVEDAGACAGVRVSAGLRSRRPAPRALFAAGLVAAALLTRAHGRCRVRQPSTLPGSLRTRCCRCASRRRSAASGCQAPSASSRRSSIRRSWRSNRSGST